MKGKYPEYPTDPISEIRGMFLASTERYARRIALQHKKAGQWIPISYRELRVLVEEAAAGLAALGLRPRETKLAIVGDNRPEWAVSYLAAATTGVVCVPIDRDLRETEVYHILYLSGADAIMADGKHVDIAREVQKKLPSLKHVVNMDPWAEGLDFEQLRALGRERIAAGTNDFRNGHVEPDWLLSILFTSGTMGNSKGVMLTHANVTCNMIDAVKWVDLCTEDRFLSVLPMHHAYECTDGFLLSIYRGALTSYAENLRRIPENLAETKSTVMLGVPLLWENMYRRMLAGMAEKGMWKVRLGKRIADFSQTVLGKDIRRKVFGELHQKFGGALRLVISGGAPINPAVSRGFRELGIGLLQGYGLTESSPIIAVNRNKAFKDEAVGLPLPSVEVKIAPDGEILARGPNVMQGYYNNPEATRDTLEDGWLHTGDLGAIDSDGFLHVLGRKKAVIVTPGGKKIYPEEVEAEILKSPYILECLVWGDSGGAPGEDVEVNCTVVPDTEYFISQGVEKKGPADQEKIESVLRREVKHRCLHLASYKRVTKISVRYEEFEKTTTRKIKRYLYTGKSALLTDKHRSQKTDSGEEPAGVHRGRG